MIRQANKYDKTIVIEMMKEFYDELQFETKIDLDNKEHHEQLFNSIIAGRGIIFLEENKGLIIGVINPTFFCPKTLVMNCLAWAVKQKYRNTPLGYRLLKTYIDYAEKLKQQQRIKYYTINKTPKTPNMDYTKLGFRKTDEVWAK